MRKRAVCGVVLVVGWIRNNLANHACQVRIGDLVFQEAVDFGGAPRTQLLALSVVCLLMTRKLEAKVRTRILSNRFSITRSEMSGFLTWPRVCTCIQDQTHLLPIYYQTRLVVLFLCSLHKGLWCSSGLLDQPFSPDRCHINEGQGGSLLSSGALLEGPNFTIVFPCIPQWNILILNTVPLSATSPSRRWCRRCPLHAYLGCDIST